MSDQVDAVQAADKYLETERRNRILIAVLSVIVVAVLILVPIAIVRQNEIRHDAITIKQNQVAIQDNQRSLQKIQLRNDCARAINDENVEVRESRNNAKARLDSAYIEAQLDVAIDPSLRDHWITELDRLQKELDAAIAAVDALEPLQDAVDRECPSVTVKSP